MYQLNKRCGFFKKRLAQNEGEKYHYFFIANSGLMYFDQNWFRVRSLINQSKTLEEVEEKLVKDDYKFIELKRYQVSSAICNHPYGDQAPFINKLCFEMISEQSQYQSLLIFGLSDDTDIYELYNYIRTIDASTKKDNVENSPHNQMNNILSSGGDKQDINEKSTTFFNYIQQQYTQQIEENKEDDNKNKVYLYDLMNQLDNQINNAPQDEQEQQQMQELSDQVTYSGQMANNMPHGFGKEFSNDGIQYEGSYRFGKRHGPGQFVDSNLDMHQYEYIMGRPVGI